MIGTEIFLEMLMISIWAIVLFLLYHELYKLITYSVRTSGRSGFMMTRVNRFSVRLYFWLFVVAAALAVIVYLYIDEKTFLLIGLSGLMIGFFLHSLLFQVCFINEIGFGQVTGKNEMEFQWNEIQSYRWDRNVLYITLRKGLLTRYRLRFYDSEAMVYANELLHRQRPSPESFLVDRYN